VPRDPRELALNDVSRRILARDNYDVHFSTFEQRVIVEDRLFLARYDAVRRLKHNRVWRRDDATYAELGRAELAGAAYAILQDVRTGQITIVAETEVDGGTYSEAV
jgi:hypothetical protein